MGLHDTLLMGATWHTQKAAPPAMFLNIRL